MNKRNTNDEAFIVFLIRVKLNATQPNLNHMSTSIFLLLRLVVLTFFSYQNIEKATFRECVTFKGNQSQANAKKKTLIQKLWQGGKRVI